jgi:cytochrome c-type biogenesis protein CcmH/NrfG
LGRSYEAIKDYKNAVKNYRTALKLSDGKRGW